MEESKTVEDAHDKVAPIEAGDDAGTVDMAQAEQILFYGEGSISGPDWLKDAAQSQANFKQRLPGIGDWTIGGGVGSLGQLSREEVAAKEREETAEWFEEWSENIERVREQEREREAWANTRHSRFGADLTGNEWGELADMIGADGPARDRLIKRLMEQGKSKADAEKKAADMSQVYRLMAKPESQLTDEERAKLKAADSDPDFRSNTADAARNMKEQRQGTSYGAVNKVETVSTSAARDISIASADASFSIPSFAGAPHMSEDFRAAASPASASPGIADKPAVAIAAQAIKPVLSGPASGNSGGFDLS